MDKKVIEDVKLFARENWEGVIRDIGRLVAVDSVRGEEQPGMPFGPGPAKALKLGLEIAGELGLDTVNCENMIGYAQVGQGEKYLATITHLDVVPSAGWSEDPFTLRRREGFIIGRGVMDDKGPSVLCLYALKYLKDRGVELRYPVRALLGADEERRPCLPSRGGLQRHWAAGGLYSGKRYSQRRGKGAVPGYAETPQ